MNSPGSAETCTALGAKERRLESFSGRELNPGSLRISRALPVKGKRLVGPVVFSGSIRAVALILNELCRGVMASAA